MSARPSPSEVGGPLSAAEVGAFFDDGLIVVRDVFDAVEVAAMRRAFQRLAVLAARMEATSTHRGALFVLGDRPDGDGEGSQIQRVVWCGGADPVLARLGADPRLTRMAAQLLGSPRVVQLINQAHFKVPGDGVAFDWHQDSRHRRYGTPEWSDVNGRGSFVETVTAVDAMTEDNGPLRYVPGSARLGHLDTRGPDHALPGGAFDPSDARPVTLAPGDVALFGPYVIHGSEPNEGTAPRRSFLNGFAFPGANRRDYPGAGLGRVIDV